MKLVAAAVVYLVISAVLVAGIIAMMHGKPILLIASFLIYLLIFARTGCATQ